MLLYCETTGMEVRGLVRRMTGVLSGVLGQPASRDSRGWTLLHLAASHSKPQTVRWVGYCIMMTKMTLFLGIESQSLIVSLTF